MTRPFVSLRSEITRSHAQMLMEWLGDERVTRYLSDGPEVSRFIAQAIDRTQMPILTHLFNQGGRFFMIYDRDDVPVGFVRLIQTGRDCEIVLAIGDHDHWGRRIGSSAIREGLKLAFLDMGAVNVIAKIHPENGRSLKAFERCGFSDTGGNSQFKSLALSAGRYRRLLHEGVIGEGDDICITESDQARLQELIESAQGAVLVELEQEIERASVVASERIAGDVVTMNSRVLLRLDGEPMEFSLVYPRDAHEPSGKLSILSELGTAILGYRRGDVIDRVIWDRTRRILIDRLLYQPELAGDFHL